MIVRLSGEESKQAIVEWLEKRDIHMDSQTFIFHDTRFADGSSSYYLEVDKVRAEFEIDEDRSFKEGPYR